METIFTARSPKKITKRSKCRLAKTQKMAYCLTTMEEPCMAHYGQGASVMWTTQQLRSSAWHTMDVPRWSQSHVSNLLSINTIAEISKANRELNTTFLFTTYSSSRQHRPERLRLLQHVHTKYHKPLPYLLYAWVTLWWVEWQHSAVLQQWAALAWGITAERKEYNKWLNGLEMICEQKSFKLHMPKRLI